MNATFHPSPGAGARQAGGGPPRPAARSRRARPRPGSRLLGVLGELLLTAGAIVALFLVWQLWWTDVIAGQQQRTAVAALRESFPAATAEGTHASGPPGVVAPGEGASFAVLHLPGLGAGDGLPMKEGVGSEVLDSGAVGHYPGTALPGAVGNLALAGHRQTYGAPLRHIDGLEPGDPLVVETAEAWLVYRVTESDIVKPEDVDVIAPTPGHPGEPPSARMITLTTCHPLYSTAERWVTHGELTEWFPRSAGAPAVLTEED